MSSNKVLSYEDYIIRESDLALLEGSGWLNDTLIGFYFQYLTNNSQEAPSPCLYVGPEVTQLIKLTPTDEILIILAEMIEDLGRHEYAMFPVNNSTDLEECGGTHWSLLVLSKVDKKFVHFDSCAKSNDRDAKEIASKLGGVVTRAAAFTSSPLCSRQENGFDCGCHVLQNAVLIGDFVRSHPNASLLSPQCPTASPSQASQMRPTLRQLIHKLANNNTT